VRGGAGRNGQLVATSPATGEGKGRLPKMLQPLGRNKIQSFPVRSTPEQVIPLEEDNFKDF
jgi:hypothetical protein